MILPSKYVQEKESLLGLGAVVLRFLNEDMPLSELWECSKENLDSINFERFVLVLDLLFVMGLIAVDGQLVKRTEP
jgi:hypothetical protein